MARGGNVFHKKRKEATLLPSLGRVLRRAAVFALILFGLWLPGLVWYSATMPDQVDDPATRTDAIVVLTGGSERLSTGLQLLEQGLADVLFVSGVHPETTLDALLAEVEPVPEAVRARVTLGRVAMDTIGNAIETAVWMRWQDLHSLRLVTAAYHMPRARLEFGAALPEAVLIPHPVFPPNVKQQTWWEFPGTALLFATEYTKYLIARARLLLPDGPRRLSPPAASGPDHRGRAIGQ